MHDITLSAMIVQRTYVVMTHEMRINSVDTMNQKTIIDHIIKQNVILHKDINIMRVI